MTTNKPVAMAAAGRSQPNQPVWFGSGRNRSTTLPQPYRSQVPARRNRCASGPVARGAFASGVFASHRRHRACCLAAILPRI
ncbi:MAG TPA: hypothetical protein VNF47_16670 [Streptosporangiaceae bacterium]|nr:hypothetical protein [Streptosporangiaceae bacterium]